MEDGTAGAGHMQVLVEAGREHRFQEGRSGNPAGTTKYQRELRAAIETEQSPAKVCEVIEAMRMQALSGTKSAPAAAKVYLGVVGAEPNDADRIIKGVAAHLDQLMREAERLEAASQAPLALGPEEGK